MFNHVMIDLETLGTGTDAAVLSMGAVKFDEEGVDTEYFHFMFDVQNQLNAGRTVTADTISWWMGQSDGARQQFSTHRIQFGAGLVLDAFDQFFNGCEYIWSHGSNFDTVILDHMYTQWGRKVPWRFHNVRDTRTLFAMLHPDAAEKAKSILKPKGITEHHALRDAHNQAMAVSWVLKRIEEARES